MWCPVPRGILRGVTGHPERQAWVTVVVTEHEVVVPRGHQRVTWFVREGNAWLPTERLENAIVTLKESPPGTVWERTIDLRVLPGTELMRLESRPGPPRRQDPLDYLRQEVRLAPREVRRLYFLVDPRGNLAIRPAAGAPSPRGGTKKGPRAT